MININAKKHDNFSVEFKFGFNCTEDGVPDDFSVNTWMFVPNSLGVNSESYGKTQFYRDVKSNIRLITPMYSLSDIAKDSSQPLTLLRNSLERVVQNPEQEQDAYEYHLKMFAAIFKSALRAQVQHMQDTVTLDSAESIVEDYIANVNLVLEKFRGLYGIIDVPAVPEKTRSLFNMCDEFMSSMLELRTIRLVKDVDSYPESETGMRIREKFTQFLANEYAYKKSKGYGVMNDDPKHDRELVHHRGMLKKFIESELYIRLDKKKDGIAIRQIYSSLAAGAAMIFATAVGWYTQVKYCTLTWPLFVALVITYMLKDRIKELLRFYFAHRLDNKYFDNKARVTIGKTNVGEIKEGFDFIMESQVPAEVRKLRHQASTVEDESRIFDEKVLLYRKRMVLDDAELSKNDDYPLCGVNEIMRLHLHRFTTKMDNPVVPVDTVREDGSIASMNVEKIYYIHIVFQLNHDGEQAYHHFSVTMTRDGILDIVKQQ